MKKTAVHQLVLDVVREVAQGRPVVSGTEFSHIGLGPWQRQRFFGPLRNAFSRHGLDITGDAVTREAFMHFQTLGEVQAAVWNNVRGGPTPRPGPRKTGKVLRSTGQATAEGRRRWDGPRNECPLGSGFVAGLTEAIPAAT